MVCNIYSHLLSAQLVMSDNRVLGKNVIFSKVGKGRPSIVFSYLDVLRLFSILDNARNKEKFAVSTFD